MMGKWIGYTIAGIVLLLGSALVAFPAAVTQIAGLAVAQSSTQWNQLKDMAQGDTQQSGVVLQSPCLWNGTSCDRQRGSITGGALVSQATSGNAVFSVTRADIAAASVNLAFGFTSKKVAVSASINNTANICLDWLGATAVCPAANTAGDDTLIPGQTMILDNYAVTSLSVIAASGTQTVSIDAWN